jgi:hypothetical protein
MRAATGADERLRRGVSVTQGVLPLKGAKLSCRSLVVPGTNLVVPGTNLVVPGIVVPVLLKQANWTGAAVKRRGLG